MKTTSDDVARPPSSRFLHVSFECYPCNARMHLVLPTWCWLCLLQCSAPLNRGEKVSHVASMITALALFGLATLARAAPPELPVSEVAPGIFVHSGTIALMTREN